MDDARLGGRLLLYLIMIQDIKSAHDLKAFYAAITELGDGSMALYVDEVMRQCEIPFWETDAHIFRAITTGLGQKIRAAQIVADRINSSTEYIQSPLGDVGVGFSFYRALRRLWVGSSTIMFVHVHNEAHVELVRGKFESELILAAIAYNWDNHHYLSINGTKGVQFVVDDVNVVDCPSDDSTHYSFVKHQEKQHGYLATRPRL